MNKKILYAGLMTGALIVSVAMPVFAENEGNHEGAEGQKPKMVGTAMMPGFKVKMEDNMEGDAGGVTMRPNGEFRIAGAVVNSVDVSGNTITGTLLGVTRTVNVGSASIIGRGEKITLGDIQAGDKIIVSGNWNAGTHTLTVKEVRDPSYKKPGTADNSLKIQDILKQLEQLRQQLLALQGHH